MEHQQTIIKDLGGGLILRRSTPADADRLADFNAGIHGEDPTDAQGVAAWTRDLLTGPHPTFGSGDFTIVENTATGAIVSSLNTISQTWAYEGIPFGVGRPELVGTLPEYRARGLVREQFNVVHEWSRQRGELVQVITGIPYFYRQFGYEMGLDLSGGRGGYEPQVPRLKEGETEPFCFRAAQASDIPWLMQMYERGAARSMVSAVRSEAEWRNEMLEKSQENVNRYDLRVIETAEGQPVGYLAHPGNAWGTMMAAVGFELQEGVSFQRVSPSVIRYLWSTGEAYARQHERTLNSFGFWLGSQHPAYDVLARRLVFQRPAYAYFVRVPDLPAFLRLISPVLERRLSLSPSVGYSGELKISFYRDGLRMVFEDGRITTIEAWRPTVKDDEGAAAFPNLTFLQLVFGYRSLPDLRYAYADCFAQDEAHLLLETLFPKKHSSVWPVS